MQSGVRMALSLELHWIIHGQGEAWPGTPHALQHHIKSYTCMEVVCIESSVCARTHLHSRSLHHAQSALNVTKTTTRAEMKASSHLHRGSLHHVKGLVAVRWRVEDGGGAAKVLGELDRLEGQEGQKDWRGEGRGKRTGQSRIHDAPVLTSLVRAE